MKNSTKAHPIEPMDERQQQITARAILWGFLFLVACLIAATVYRIITTGDAGWELFAIVGAAGVILLARRIMGDVEQPLDYANRPLPLGSTKAERLARCRHYAIGSVFFGAAFGLMDILLIAFGENENSEYELAQLIFPKLSTELTIAITAVIAFVIMFAVSFLFDYLVGEWKVKRYTRMIAQLDAQEQDDTP